MATRWLTFSLIPLLAGCAAAQATRTSQNTLQIDAGAAPACGARGAARVAAKAAAIETIKAGYERYIIGGGYAQNNVRVSQLPGEFNTTGQLSYGGGSGSYSGTTTYTPGPTIVTGSHDRNLNVIMFNKGDPGYEQGLDARQALGPEWQEIVKNGVRTCL